MGVVIYYFRERSIIGGQATMTPEATEGGGGLSLSETRKFGIFWTPYNIKKKKFRGRGAEISFPGGREERSN